MSPLTKMIYVMAGITLLMYVCGLMGSTPTIIQLMAPESAELTDISSFILAAILSSAAGIAIGFYSKNVELAVATVVIGTMLTMLSGFINVFNVLASAGGVGRIFAILIFGPFAYTLVLFGIEWWRGFQS